VGCSAFGRGDAIPRRIAFINEKGGSGKTTLTASTAAFWALRRGRRVLAIDLDPQGQLGKALGVDVRAPHRSAVDLLLDQVLDDAALDGPPPPEALPGDLPRLRTRIPGLDLVVANKALALAPGLEGSSKDPTGRLRASLDRARELSDYDFVLVDAPPSFGPLTLNALRAVDEVVIPVPLTYLALDGCAELERTLATVRSRYGHRELRISMVIPTFYRRTRLAQEILERLQDRFPKQIAHTVLGLHVKIDEAQSRGLSIFEYAPKDRGAVALGALAEELQLRTAEEDEA
jgi:chromosome partitioning protein